MIEFIKSVSRYELKRIDTGSTNVWVNSQANAAVTCANIITQILEENHLQWKEAFIVLCLNRKLRVTGYHILGLGSAVACTVGIPELFTLLLQDGTQNFVIGHNHPSNDVTPSLSDDKLTSRIALGSKILGLNMVDSFIVSDQPDKFYSYASEGKLTTAYATESELFPNANTRN